MLRPQCQIDYNQFPGYQWICLPKTVFISLYQSIAYYYILDLACLGLNVEQCMRWTSPTTLCLSSSGRTYPSETSFALRGSGGLSREWSPRGPFHPGGCQDCNWEWSGLMVLGSTVKHKCTAGMQEMRTCQLLEFDFSDPGELPIRVCQVSKMQSRVAGFPIKCDLLAHKLADPQPWQSRERPSTGLSQKETQAIHSSGEPVSNCRVGGLMILALDLLHWPSDASHVSTGEANSWAADTSVPVHQLSTHQQAEFKELTTPQLLEKIVHCS